MTPQRSDGDPAPTRHPVFLDETGRRRRWVNRSGAVLIVACAAYAGVVGGEMAQTGVGPLSYVPEAGNGLIAGFPADPGVPGLLAASPEGVARRSETTTHRATVPAEARAVAFRRPVRTAAPRPAATRPSPTATPADGSPRRPL